jgi:hypothetical protein
MHSEAIPGRNETLVKACLLTLLTPALAVSMTAGGAAKPPPPLPASQLPASRFITSAPLEPPPQPAPLNSGCASLPHACGYPDWSNSGVPYGTTLLDVPSQVSSGPGWYYDPGGWVEVVGNGADLSGLYIPGDVDVNNVSNVTIQDDKIEGYGQSSIGIELRNANNVTIENNDIQGLDNGNGRLQVGIKDLYGDSAGLQILNNNIYLTATGIQVAQGLIQGNFIHNMGYMPGDHINGITVSGGTTPLTIHDNTVLVNFGQTDAISFFQDTGIEGNKTVTDNLLGGGGYTIYGGDGDEGPASNIVITNNRISTMFFPLGGIWGPVIDFSPDGYGNQWWDNIWDATGQWIEE